METVTISPKYQVVIPMKIRYSFQFSLGQKVQMIPCGNRIELIPVQQISKMRGFLIRRLSCIYQMEKYLCIANLILLPIMILAYDLRSVLY